MSLYLPVIPLLIEGVPMPSEQDLPENMKEFSYRNSAKVRPAADFDQDVERLIAGLEAVVGPPSTVENMPKSQRKLSDIEQIKLEALETQQAVAIEKYKAASYQLSGTLSEADKVTIRVQIKTIERELQQINKDISVLLSRGESPHL